MAVIFECIKGFKKVFIHLIWKILFIIGLLSLITELIFMIVELGIMGNQTLEKYTVVWFASSILCLITSGLIAGLIYAKQYIYELRNWLYGKY